MRYTMQQNDCFDEKVLIMFWLAIHAESIEIARILYEASDTLKNIVKNIIKASIARRSDIQKDLQFEKRKGSGLNSSGRYTKIMPKILSSALNTK